MYWRRSALAVCCFCCMEETVKTKETTERSRFRLMKLLDLYILRQFFLATMVGIVGFIIIYVAVDLMEKLDKFLDHHVPFAIVVEYYVNFTPQIIALILPVALLLGSLFATGRMSA